MNLIERSGKLATDVVEIKALNAVAGQAEAIRTRAAQFEEALGVLRLSAGSARKLRERNISLEAETQPAAGIAHFVGQLFDAVKDDPAAILAAQDVQPKILGPLGKLSSHLQNAADQAWGRHIRQQLPSVSVELLDALGRVPALRPKVEHFRSLRDRATSLGARAPTKDADFDVAAVLIDQCNTAWRELDAEGIPKDLLQFFREAAGPLGANIGRLSPTVIAWLEQHRLTEAFGIRIR